MSDLQTRVLSSNCEVIQSVSQIRHHIPAILKSTSDKQDDQVSHEIRLVNKIFFVTLANGHI